MPLAVSSPRIIFHYTPFMVVNLVELEEKKIFIYKKKQEAVKMVSLPVEIMPESQSPAGQPVRPVP